MHGMVMFLNMQLLRPKHYKSAAIAALPGQLSMDNDTHINSQRTVDMVILI